MKRILTLLLLFFAPSVFCQKYYPFPDSNAVWNVDYEIDCQASPAKWYGGVYSIVMKGDTVVNGKTYKQLWMPYLLLSSDFFCNPNPTPQRNVFKGAIRQDKVAKKVYFTNGGAEQLLYDFNLKVGDTSKSYIAALNYNVVEEVDSVFIDGAYRKRWKIGKAPGYYIIEGIGAGGLIERRMEISSYSYNTICFKINNKIVYTSSSICETITGINTNKPSENKVTVFPNPSSNGAFTIQSEGIIKEVLITDLLGKTVFHQQVVNASTCSINELGKGTYILSLFDKNNHQSNNKIIVCD